MQAYTLSGLILTVFFLLGGCQGGPEGQQLENANLEASGEAEALQQAGEGPVDQEEQGEEGDDDGENAYQDQGEAYGQGAEEGGAGQEYGGYEGLSDYEGFGNDSQLFGNQQTESLDENFANPQPAPPEQSYEELPPSLNEEVKPLEGGEAMPEASGKIGEANEFSGAPYIPGTLRNMADGEAPEEYIVEFGDTLFDICSQLLGEGGYWPKLWSLNSYIKNPHFIWPGMRLRFYPGDEEEPPFIEVVQEEELLPVPEESLDMEKMVSELVVPERMELNLRPVEVVGRDDIEDNSEDYETVGKIFNTDKVQLTLPGFIYPGMQKPECTVVGGAMGEYMMGEDKRFVCRGTGELEAGSSYTALRYIMPLARPDGGAVTGHLYQYIAHVKMERIIGAGGMFLGMVTKSRLGLEEGDLIVPYQSTRRSVSLSQNFSNPTDSEARIVAFGSAGQTIGGMGNMVFLDKGKDDGVNAGQLMTIDQSLQYFVQSYKIDEKLDDSVTIGYLRIVDVTDSGAVGYIVYNTSEVLIGDFAGRSES